MKPALSFGRALRSGPVRARLFFSGALVLFGLALADTLHGEDVAFRGLNADLGAITAGTLLTHRVTVENRTGAPLLVVSLPTCGCALDGPQEVRIGPHRTQVIPIGYTTTGARPGLHERAVSLVYRINGQARQVEGAVRFHVRSK